MHWRTWERLLQQEEQAHRLVLADLEGRGSEDAIPAGDLNALVTAVGFTMQPQICPSLRPAAERYLAKHFKPRTQRYKFEDGELDYVRDLGATDAALYQADPAWAGRGRWVAKKATNAIFLNTEVAPFDSVAICSGLRTESVHAK